MIRAITTAVIVSFGTSHAIAEIHCATFDQHTVGTIFTTPGTVLFKDNIMEIRTAGFPAGYGNAEVVVDNGIGAAKHVVSLNNASFQLVANKPFTKADAAVRDQGGFEMVGVTGAFATKVELHDSPNVSTPLAKIDGAVNPSTGVGNIGWTVTGDQHLFSITAGGQEFSVGKVCIEVP